MIETRRTVFRAARVFSLLTALSLVIAALLLSSSALLAQEATPAPPEEGSAGAVGTQRTVTADDVNMVARELWCPLCSGVRLDACELKACDQMKEMIEIQLSEGQDLQTIKNYFVEQYGPQVLGEPPRSGFNWLAWILPFVVVIGGGVYLWSRARSMKPEAAGAPSGAGSGPAAPDDPYERKLEEELKRYD